MKHLSLQIKLWLREASKFVSDTYALTNLTPSLELPHRRHSTFHSTGYNLDLTMQFFIFLAPL